MLAAHWKNTADDLRYRAARVMTPVATPGKISARVAAQVLSGIVGHVANTYSVAVMQAACATLVRNEPTWVKPELATVRLPLENGAVPEPIKLIALVAHGLIPLAGADNVRDALSFWATEDDPGVWTRILQS